MLQPQTHHCSHAAKTCSTQGFHPGAEKTVPLHYPSCCTEQRNTLLLGMAKKSTFSWQPIRAAAIACLTAEARKELLAQHRHTAKQVSPETTTDTCLNFYSADSKDNKRPWVFPWNCLAMLRCHLHREASEDSN